MRMRYKSALMLIFVLIVGCISLRVSYAFYVEVIKNDALIIVDGKITINYLNGNEFKNINDSDYKFSVTNNGNETAYYYIELSNVKAGDVSYKLSGNKLNINEQLINGSVSNYIAIESNETQSYELNFENNDGLEYSGVIKIGVEFAQKDTFAEIVLKENEVKDGSVTVFKEVSLENEGLIKNNDDHGVSYFFRGKVENNYVSFADLTWRIVKINGDGSIKLVLNNIIDEISSYYNEDFSYENSTILTKLESWYNLNLINYSDIIANYKFCNDTLVEDDSGIYASYNRISVNYIPNNICLGNKYSAKIGLLTADEVALAGATDVNNQSFYLYNSEITTDYYTMTSGKNVNGVYYPYIVTKEGALSVNTQGTLLRGVRPVINIVKNVTVEGNGTIENPYKIIVEDN